jgi:hypothetical protein
MNGHRQTGWSGPFRVHFYPRRILLANNAARNDFSNFPANFPESFSSFRKFGGGGMGWGQGGLIVVVMEWLRRLIISNPFASQARSPPTLRATVRHAPSRRAFDGWRISR